EELVRLVPRSLREASLALGVPQWRTSLRVVLRTALGGIMTAILLAVARAAGETAPLLFTSLNNQYWNFSADQPTASLTVQIFNYAVSPYQDWHDKAWSADRTCTRGAWIPSTCAAASGWSSSVPIRFRPCRSSTT